MEIKFIKIEKKSFFKKKGAETGEGLKKKSGKKKDLYKIKRKE